MGLSFCGAARASNGLPQPPNEHAGRRPKHIRYVYQSPNPKIRWVHQADLPVVHSAGTFSRVAACTVGIPLRELILDPEADFRG